MHWRAAQPATEAGAAGAHRGGPEWLQVVRELDKEDLALLVQFVTGTSKVPLDGFKALQVCPWAPSLLMLSTKCSDVCACTAPKGSFVGTRLSIHLLL